MIATIERVSKFGVMIDGNWKNLSKFHKGVSLEGFSKGDRVEIELEKDIFITSLTHAEVSNERQEKKEFTNKTTQQDINRPSLREELETNRTAAISRQSAYNAVMGSPWLGEFYKAMDYSEAVSEAMTLIEKLSQYAQNGNSNNN